MQHPKNIAIEAFSYHLPDERIAKYPLLQRDASKLLVYKKGTISQAVYAALPDFLPADTLMVFNNTKVVEARLLFQKETGGLVELFCLEPSSKYPDITHAMLQKGNVVWKCLIGGAKKWKTGCLTKTVNIKEGTLQIKAEKIGTEADSFMIAFSWNMPEISFAEILHYAGNIPLPPYLNREAEKADAETYQTVYAKHDGSVAAPTAGLHFTNELLQKLHDKGIQQQFITLHVGAGTFKPVKAKKMEDHEMHEEFIDVSLNFIQLLASKASNTIVAVGTTSLRTIETLYWMGVKLLHIPKNMQQVTIADISVRQWDPYELPSNFSLQQSLLALANWMELHAIQQLITKTQIIIAPGYQLKVASGIITNFHQPQSTLLLLISAVVGNDWKRIYNYALENDFRFLSYGDGSLLWDVNR